MPTHRQQLKSATAISLISLQIVYSYVHVNAKYIYIYMQMHNAIKIIKKPDNSQATHQLLAILQSQGLHLCPVEEKVNMKQCLTISQHDTLCPYVNSWRCIYILPGALLLQCLQAPVVLEARHPLRSPMIRKKLGFAVSNKMRTHLIATISSTMSFHLSILCYLLPCRANRSSQSSGSRWPLHKTY